jgi:hypothetical protein
MPALPRFLLAILVSLYVLPAAAEDLVLADNGKSKWQIVNRSPKAVGTPFAAEELAKYVKQISGVKLSSASKESSLRSSITIGLRQDLPAKDQALLPARQDGFDGYAIAISEKPRRIIIAGDNGQGVIYGVYDFLEELGCRWFYPTEDANDPEVVPRLETIAVKPKSWAVASPIRFRIANGSAWYFKMPIDPAKRQVDWAMKNRYNAIGWQAAVAHDGKSLLQQYRELEQAGVLGDLEKRGMFIHGPAHCFDHFLKAADHFDKHPEWFGMRDAKRAPQTFAGAQFCWSNPDARSEVIKNAEAFITNAPLIKIYCVIPFDGGVACDCPECKKAGASNTLMLLLGELIDKLKTSRPDVLVETVGGYGAVKDPPTNAKIHPEQRVVWAHWGRHHGTGYDDPKYNLLDNLNKWREAARGGLTICQYYTDNFAEPWVMGPFTHAMQGDRKYFLQHKVDALYMLMYPLGYWWNHSLNGYIGGRVFYDVSLDPFAEIPDYANHYFGPKAGPLLGAYYTAWAKDIDLSYRVRGDSRKQDRAALAAQRKQFIDPAVTAAKGNSLYAYRVSKVERLHTLAEKMTESHRQRDVIQILRRQGKFEEAARLLGKARGATDEVMSLFYALADTNQGLIERKEVGGFIKAGVQNWIETEAKAIAAKDKHIEPNPWKQLDETEMLPADLLTQ